jgi:hypothetical protein
MRQKLRFDTIWAIYGHSPALSHGHLNVSSAPDTGRSRVDHIGRLAALAGIAGRVVAQAMPGEAALRSVREANACALPRGPALDLGMLD